MCEMTNRHFPLHVDVGQEWSLVIDAEREYAMLVWQAECSAEDGAIECCGYRLEVESVERRKHSEFQLEFIVRGDGEWGKMIKGVL